MAHTSFNHTSSRLFTVTCTLHEHVTKNVLLVIPSEIKSSEYSAHGGNDKLKAKIKLTTQKPK